MPVKVNSITYRSELSDERTDYLIGAILDKKVVELDVSAEWYLKRASGTNVIFQGSGIWVTDGTGNSTGATWESMGFFVGDYFVVSNATSNTGTFQIVSFSADGLVAYVSVALTSHISTTAVIIGITEVTGINFRYNIKENSATNDFYSLVDGNELRFSKGGLNYTLFTPYTALQQGVYKSNHQGSVVIRGYGRQYVASSGAHLVFDLSDGAITWSDGDFINDGIKVGDSLAITGTGSNNITFVVTAVTETELTGTGILADEDTAAGTITRAAILNRFTIYHTYVITPLYDNAEETEYLNNIAPSLYFDSNCPTYIYGVDMLYSLQDPNKKHILNNPDYKIGNVGYRNENFNGDVNFYSMDAPTYSIGGNTVDNPDPNQATDFEIVINGNGFSNNNTRFIINHFILPESASQFKNTQTDFDTNFMFDRALQTVGAASVNGDKFGGVQQVFTDIVGTFVNANQIVITGKIDLSAAYQTRISALLNKRFDISVTVQNYTLETEESDLVNLKPEATQFYSTDLSNPNVGGNDINFFFHTQRDNGDSIKIQQSNPLNFAGWFVEDDILSRSQFFVDKTNGALIQSLNVVIKASHPTYGSFELERRNFDFASAIQINGVQQMSLNTTRGFALKAGNPFNLVTLNRKSSLDTGNNYYYELFYAFRPRWEYFKQLLGVNSQFFDATMDFNGYNHNWNRYFAQSGWSLQFTNDLIIEENGELNTITTSRDLTALTYGDADDWEEDEVILKRNSDNVNEGDYLLTNAVSRLECIFTYIGATLPDIGDLEGEIKIERYEQDGLIPIGSISTVWENNDNEILVSILGNNLCKKEYLGANQFQLTCLVDNTKLDLLANGYKFSPRIYQTNLVPLGTETEQYKIFQEANDFMFQDYQQYRFQS